MCFTCGQAIGKIRTIINGITYYHSGTNEELFQERYTHCKTCKSSVQGLFCGECKCLLQAKLRLEEEACPLKLW